MQNVPNLPICNYCPMARTARASKGGICYHVINRGNGRSTVYHTASDYRFFIGLMGKACDRIPMRILSYCLMPNHFHLVLWPINDGDLSRWMQWLMTCHVRRYHRLRGTSGRIWQGRFKAFPIQQDAHLLTVIRYVERNPVRANLTICAAEWKWSSASVEPRESLLTPAPVQKPDNWLEFLNSPQNQVEVDAIRRCATRDAPYGTPAWTSEAARELGLEANVSPLGRPVRR